MPIPRSLRRWLYLPSRVALILGLGALSTAGAQAAAPDQTNLGSFGDISIRSEGRKIYLSEGGRDFEQLQLKDTPEVRYLKQLLKQHDAAAGGAGLRFNPTVVAGGGGTGFSLWGLKQSITHTPDAVPQDPPQVTAPPNLSGKGAAPRRRTPATDKKS